MQKIKTLAVTNHGNGRVTFVDYINQTEGTIEPGTRSEFTTTITVAKTGCLGMIAAAVVLVVALASA